MQVWGAINSSNGIKEIDFPVRKGHGVSEEPVFGHLYYRLQQCQSNKAVPLFF